MQTYKIIANVQQYSQIKIKNLSATSILFVGICKDFTYPESKLKQLIPYLLEIFII